MDHAETERHFRADSGIEDDANHLAHRQRPLRDLLVETSASGVFHDQKEAMFLFFKSRGCGLWGPVLHCRA